jgi:hypothetical protein
MTFFNIAIALYFTCNIFNTSLTLAPFVSIFSCAVWVSTDYFEISNAVDVVHPDAFLNRLLQFLDAARYAMIGVYPSIT